MLLSIDIYRQQHPTITILSCAACIHPTDVTSDDHLLHMTLCDPEEPATFAFLGFTHYCSKSKNGRFRVKRKTNRKKFSKKIIESHRKIGDMRTLPAKDIVKKLNEILVGYFHYYGITDNTRSIKSFRYEVMKSLFYWLNRRSQKKSYNWVDFLEMLDTCHPLAEAKIYVNIYAQ